MSNELNKTEADFVYERYTKMGSPSPEQSIPIDDLQTTEPTPESHTPNGSASNDINEVIDDDSDPVLVGDPYLGADIGLNTLEQTPDRSDNVLSSPAPERDDLLESDAILIAEAAGLTGSVIDYAEDEELMKDKELLEDEDLPLEDIPDADEIEPGSAIDPASPPVDAMPGTDVINGSQG